MLLSRRRFLRTTAVGAGALSVGQLVLSGCDGATPPCEPLPRSSPRGAALVRESHPPLSDGDRLSDLAAWLGEQRPSQASPLRTLRRSSGNDDQVSAPILAFELGLACAPSVQLQACTHGSEMGATHGLVTFVQRVADPSLAEPENADAFARIRDGLRLCVIPCLSPAAYQPSPSRSGGSRKAPSFTGPPYHPHLGTDPNRNWPWRWAEYLDERPELSPVSATYPGTHSASLPEVQAAIAYFEECRPFAGIDVHTFPQYEEEGAPTQAFGLDRNATSYAGPYRDWAADRQAELAALLPEFVEHPFNITGVPTATGWFSQQVAPDGQPVYGQIVEASSHVDLTGNARGEEAEVIVNALLVLCTALVAEAETRALGCATSSEPGPPPLRDEC